MTSDSNRRNSPEDLLATVCDRDSFISFVRSLAAERSSAQKIESEHPERYLVDGALNWKNGDISSFLYASLDYFEERPFHVPETEPSWKMFAEILYCGKIIE